MTDLFPDCEIYPGDQRTPKWHSLRAGKLTASNAGEWLLDGPKVRTTIDEAKAYLDSQGISYKKSGKRAYFLDLLPEEMKIATLSKESANAKETAINDILDSMVEDPTEPDFFADRWMQRGIDLEPLAFQAFVNYFGSTITQVCFCQSIHGSFGCSPDGLFATQSEGIEIKVLKGTTHLKYLREGVVPKEYLVQVLFSMAVTGAKGWHYWGWSPVYPPLYVYVRRDETVDRLKQRLIEFSESLEDARQDMEQKWNSWNHKRKPNETASLSA